MLAVDMKLKAVPLVLTDANDVVLIHSVFKSVTDRILNYKNVELNSESQISTSEIKELVKND